MSNHEISPAKAAHQLAVWWRVAYHCYRYANRATHHVLGALVKLGIAAYFIFSLLFLSLRYVVLPNIGHYKPQVEQMASHALGRQVSIASLSASWSGLLPTLSLTNVVMHDRMGGAVLKLPSVSATFSWWSVLVANVRLHSLEISAPDVDIVRDADGNLTIGGMFIDLHKKSDGLGADWLLAQREIVVRDGRIRWNDALRAAPELKLEAVTVILRNDWLQHRIAFKATPPAAFAEPIDLRVAFTHPRFSSEAADYKRWKGELYADLKNTDLALWKPYLDYPLTIQTGRGGVRAWLQFDSLRVANLTADLALKDVLTQLRADLTPILLPQVGGRISVHEELSPQPDTPSANPNTTDHTTFGANGHTISLINFSLQTNDGLRLPPSTISETYVPAKKDQLERTEVKAKSLDLRSLAEFIERLPLPAAQLKMLTAFEPRGQLKDFTAQWQGTYPDVASYGMKGDFTGLSLKAQAARPARAKSANLPAQAALPAIPGFDNLSGHVDANEQGGTFTLDSSQLNWHVGAYFADPVMSFNRLKMQAGWTFPDKEHLMLKVSEMAFMQEGLLASMTGSTRISLTAAPGTGIGEVDLEGSVAEFDLKQIDRFLPLKTPAATRTWLTGALRGGTARDVSIRIKGELANFPFAVDKASAKSNGEFRVAGRIDNGQLLYVPGAFARDGKAPLWPVLDKINATILFDRTRMEIFAKSASTHGVPMTNIKATVPDLGARDLLLNLEGSAAGALNDMLRYTADSPVTDMIGHFTDESRAVGTARLGLKITLPLARLQDSKVLGTLQFANNDVTLMNGMPALQNVNGKVDFNERGVNLTGVKGNFVGGPITITGGTQRDDNLLIKAEGSVSSAGFRRAYTQPAMQRLADRFNGSTRFNATLSVKKQRPELLVESNLQGLALDFPAPLKKSATENLPLKLDMALLAGDSGPIMRDEIKLAIGPAISARYLRQKGPDKNAVWRVQRGGIGVNVPAPQPDSGLVASVNMQALSIDAWSEFAGIIAGNDKPRAPIAPIAANTADAINMAQYIEPDVLAGRVTELQVLGKKLNNVVIGASYQKDKALWQANIDADQASGYVSWNAGASGQGIGRATARLSSLIIPKSAATDVTDLLAGKNSATQMPGLDIVADNFELFGKKFGRLELVANNVLASATREWRISKLALSNPDADLRASGKWSVRDGDSITSLNYTLELANAGNMLTRLGFANAVRGGKGSMSGELSWSGLPFALDIPSMSGQIKLNMENGQFLKVDSGTAKLISVLNLQSLPRRLTLDFRDVFSEGFAFDGITADATVVKGVAATDNFKMRSVSATVLLDGTADISQESQNLHAVVIPEINAGTASVVYALAVNPVIGVGTFLAQLFLREPLSKAFTYEYKITGPWQDPVVTKIERKADAAASPASSAASPSTPSASSTDTSKRPIP